MEEDSEEPVKKTIMRSSIEKIGQRSTVADGFSNSATNGERRQIVFRKMVDLPSTTYATFGLYRYPAKFIPQVVAYILKQYTNSKMTIFDPFAGCGTVGVVSKLYGNDYELWDLNPMLETLHKIATMRPSKVNVSNIRSEIFLGSDEFVPGWSRIQYWFPEEFLPFLYKVWGYYHSLPENELKLILTIPLLKVTRHYSYDEPQRQKLSISNRSRKRVNDLLSSNWKDRFSTLLQREIERVVKGICEYEALAPRKTKSVVRGGVDSLTTDLNEKKDVLITSPPYLQSQEYMRQAKLDLFWLGHTEEEIKTLGKLEIPYRDIPACPIYSKTFLKYEGRIEERHIRKIFDRYFWGVTGALTQLQKNINSHIFLFVGHTSTRGQTIPIDQILIEHFSELGWLHKATLIDKIPARRMFAYGTNPASGIVDVRTSVENLVILVRK